MPYLQILATVAVVVVLAWLADLISGRRSLPNMMVVGITGGLAGAFLGLRVFAVSNYDSWKWPVIAVIGAVAALLVYFLFRNKR